MRSLLPVVLGALLLPLARQAHAGPLAKNVEGMRSAAGSKAEGGAKDAADPKDVVTAVASALYRGVIEPPDQPAGVVVATVGPAAPPPGEATEVFLYFGAQSVVDSNGSVSAELRASYGDFALGLRDTHYYEHTIDGTYELDVWGLSGHWRALGDPVTALWLEVGLGQLVTPPDLYLWGAHVGLRAEHELRPSLRVALEARAAHHVHGITALEVRAALQASVVRVSYRVLDLDAGPPLHGPEVGLAFTF